MLASANQYHTNPFVPQTLESFVSNTALCLLLLDISDSGTKHSSAKPILGRDNFFAKLLDYIPRDHMSL